MFREPSDKDTEPVTMGRSRPRRRGLGPWPVFLVLGLIAVLILREEVPAVDGWLEGWLAPDRARARAACLQAALQGASQPAFARLLSRGEVSSTQAGFHVEGVLVGEMGSDGAERVYEFSCYVDAAGNLAGTHREAGTRPPVRPDGTVEEDAE